MLNDDEKLERMALWAKGESPPPFQIEFRPTNRCNLKCPSCYSRGKPPFVQKEELTHEECMNLLESAADLGVRQIHLSGGGEPLARPKTVIPFMKRMKELGLQGSLVTNGTLFRSGHVRAIVEAGWDYILFSIDGPDAEINDMLRGKKGAFRSAMTAVRRFVEWKRELGTDMPWLVLGPVVSRYNYNRITEFIDLTLDIGMDEILLQPINVFDFDLGGHLLLEPMHKAIFSEHVRRAHRIARIHRLQNNFGFIDDNIICKSTEINEVVVDDVKDMGKDEESGEDDGDGRGARAKLIAKVSGGKVEKEATMELMGPDDPVVTGPQQEVPPEYAPGPLVDPRFLSLPCYSPWFFMEVDADGRVSPCGAGKPIEYGNVKERSLEEIWYGEGFTELREQILSGDLPPECKICCGATVLSNRILRMKLLRPKKGIYGEVFAEEDEREEDAEQLDSDVAPPGM